MLCLNTQYHVSFKSNIFVNNCIYNCCLLNIGVNCFSYYYNIISNARKYRLINAFMCVFTGAAT